MSSPNIKAAVNSCNSPKARAGAGWKAGAARSSAGGRGWNGSSPGHLTTRVGSGSENSYDNDGVPGKPTAGETTAAVTLSNSPGRRGSGLRLGSGSSATNDSGCGTPNAEYSASKANFHFSLGGKRQLFSPIKSSATARHSLGSLQSGGDGKWGRAQPPLGALSVDIGRPTAGFSPNHSAVSSIITGHSAFPVGFGSPFLSPSRPEKRKFGEADGPTHGKSDTPAKSSLQLRLSESNVAPSPNKQAKYDRSGGVALEVAKKKVEGAPYLCGGFRPFAPPTKVHAMYGGRDKLVLLSEIVPAVAPRQELSEEDIKRTASYRGDLGVQTQRGYDPLHNFGPADMDNRELAGARMMYYLPDQLRPEAVSFFHKHISIVDAQMRLYGCNNCGQMDLSYASSSGCCDYLRVMAHVEGLQKTIGGCLTRFDPCKSCGMTYEDAQSVPGPSGQMLVAGQDYASFARHRSSCQIGATLDTLQKKIAEAGEGKMVSIPKNKKLDDLLMRATGKWKNNGGYNPWTGSHRAKLEPLLPRLRRGKTEEGYEF